MMGRVYPEVNGGLSDEAIEGALVESESDAWEDELALACEERREEEHEAREWARSEVARLRIEPLSRREPCRQAVAMIGALAVRLKREGRELAAGEVHVHVGAWMRRALAQPARGALWLSTPSGWIARDEQTGRVSLHEAQPVDLVELEPPTQQERVEELTSLRARILAHVR